MCTKYHLSNIFTCSSNVIMPNIRKCLVKMTFRSHLQNLNGSLSKSLSSLKVYFHTAIAMDKPIVLVGAMHILEARGKHAAVFCPLLCSPSSSLISTQSQFYRIDPPPSPTHPQLPASAGKRLFPTIRLIQGGVARLNAARNIHFQVLIDSRTNRRPTT